jgi:hypothetical protein
MFKLFNGAKNIQCEQLNKKLLFTNKKFYNGLFERPTQSLFSHLQMIGIIESIEFF